MMRKSTIIIISIIITNFNLLSQDYFQQDLNYIIDVELNDKKHLLIAEMTIDYTNNSPDNLDILWFHIWPNAYKNNTTALAKQKLSDGDLAFQYATEKERGYISNLNFRVNNKKVDWQYHPEHIDICELILNKPIKPGETITISTPFKVKIPDAKFSRLGHVDQSYMITQWYPKPAVYDKNGWHTMPYLNQGEFYSEFGSFTVNITLPRNYTVGATGDLQNKCEKMRLDEIASFTKEIKKFGTDLTFPESDKKTKTIRFFQENVHDFGWFADKRYHVLTGTVILPHSKRTVKLFSMFTNNEAELWKNSIEYLHDAVYYYSLWNGDYPYNHCTAVDGTIAAGGGMEYPNVTVIGESGNAKALEEVIMHEVGHNWFYGILGNNERDHACMDEGINSFDELRYMRTKYPEYNMILDMLPKRLIKLLDLEDYSNKEVIGELMYMIAAWTAQDQPIEFPSINYTPMNYGGIVYMKSAIVFDYLMSYLGEDLFDKCMKSYYEKWKFKHPHPDDIKRSFENETKKDLSWFFHDIIKTTGTIDYGITNVKKIKNKIEITLKNYGDIACPLVISGVKNDVNGKEIWIEGFTGLKKITILDQEYDHIRIDYNKVMPEVNRNNNIYRIKGFFKNIEPIKLQILGSLYHPEKTQIFYIPNFNWNRYNKISTGISIYNQVIPKGGFSYNFFPMYSFGTNTMVGKGNVSISKYSHESIFSKFKFGLEAEKFNYTNFFSYTRISPNIELKLNQYNLRSPISQIIRSSYIYLNKECYCENNDKYKNFIDINYSFKNSRTINPYDFNINLEGSNEFKKANLVFKYTYDINNKRKINSRFYLGKVISNNETYDLQMSAWNGNMDYSFSENSFSREDQGRLSKQMFINEGGLKHYTEIQSNNLLGSIYLNINLHNNLDLYTEAGTNLKNHSYGTGAIIKFNGIKIYIPIYTDNGIFNGDSFNEVIRIELKSLSLNIQDIM